MPSVISTFGCLSTFRAEEGNRTACTPANRSRHSHSTNIEKRPLRWMVPSRGTPTRYQFAVLGTGLSPAAGIQRQHTQWRRIQLQRSIRNQQFLMLSSYVHRRRRRLPRSAAIPTSQIVPRRHAPSLPSPSSTVMAFTSVVTLTAVGLSPEAGYDFTPGAVAQGWPPP